MPTTLPHSFHAAAAKHAGDTSVPGLVALVARGDEVHVEALGTLSIGGPPVERDSLFRIASTTKPITAAATLAVIDEGLLDLDEPVDPVLPELADRAVLRRMDGPLDDTVPAIRPVTVRDLLTFTLGFGMVMEMFTAPGPWPVVAAEGELALGTLSPPDPGSQPDPDTWIAGLGSLPLLAQPGERWMYNTGASVLGVLLARATGEAFADVLRTRLFEPLGMRDTAFWTTETGRLATAYRSTPEGLVAWDDPATGLWSRLPAFGDGAAGLISTVDDLLAFARMLLRGGDPVLSRESVRAMTSDQLAEAQKARGGWDRTSSGAVPGASGRRSTTAARSAGTAVLGPAGSSTHVMRCRRSSSPSGCGRVRTSRPSTVTSRQRPTRRLTSRSTAPDSRRVPVRRRSE